MFDFIGDLLSGIFDIGEGLVSVGNFFLSIGSTLFGFISTFAMSIVNGLSFVLDFFTIVPTFLMNLVFPNLPPFFSSTLYGLLGFMLFIVGVKVFFYMKG